MKQTLALLLVVVLLMGMMPTAVLAEESVVPEAGYEIQMNWTTAPADVGTVGVMGNIQNGYKLGTNEFWVTFNAKTPAKLSTMTVALKIDATKLNVVNPSTGEALDWSAVTSSGKQFSAGVSPDLTTYQTQTITFKPLDDTYKAMLITVAPTNATDSNGVFLMNSVMRFQAVNGVESLDKSSIRVMSKEEAQGKGISAVASLAQNAVLSYAYLPMSDDAIGNTYTGYLACPTLNYPRSEADSSIDVGGDVTKDDETGALTLPAPEKGKVYGAAGGAPESVQVKLTGLTEGAEMVKFEAGTIWTDDDLTFSIDADGKITSNKAVPGSFTGKEVTIKANILDATAETEKVLYTKTITATIPDVVLPARELNPASGSLLAKTEGNWTASEAIAEFTKSDSANSGWTLATAEQVTNFATVDNLTAVDGTTTLSVDTHTIPLYSAEVPGETRQSVAPFELTIVAAPTAGTGEGDPDGDDSNPNNVVANGAYIATETSLTFTKATNPDWEYGVVKASGDTPVEWKPGVAPAVTPTDTESETTTGGVKFDSLTSGTDYYLAVRAKAGSDTTETVYSTNAATTVFALRLDNAKLAGGEQTALQTSPAITYTMPVALTDENKSDYAYTIQFTNNNTKTIQNISAKVYTVDEAGNKTETVSQAFTAAITGVQEDGKVVGNGTFTVTVSVDDTTKLIRGANKAVLVLTADDEADNQVVNKSYPLELVNFTSRGAVTGTEDVVLRKSTSSETNAAKANYEILLNVQWTEDPSVTVTYSIPEGLDDTVKLDGSKLVLQKDIDDLGKLVTVTAKAAADSSHYYLEDVATIDVYVKGSAADALPDVEGVEKENGASGEVEYLVTRGAAAQTIDLLANFTDVQGATVNDSGNTLGGISLADGKVTVAATGDSTDKGVATYTVTIPATEYYESGEVTVKVYVLVAPEMPTLSNVDLSYQDSKIYSGETEITELTLPTVAGETVTYEIKQDGAKVENPTISGGKLTLTGLVAGATKLEITMNVAANKSTFTAAASAVQNVIVRIPAVFTGDAQYEFTAANDAGKTVALEHKVTGATMTYTQTSGTDILSVSENGTFTLADPIVNFGKVTVTASSAQTDTYLAGTSEIEIYVRGAADENPGDPGLGDPYNGTGASILGRLSTDTTDAENYKNAFDVDTDGDSVADKWSELMGGVKFGDLTPGVRYEVRYMFEDGKWFTNDTADKDGWIALNSGNGAPSTGFVIAEPLSGNVYAAQIRYASDGTVGDTTIDPADGDQTEPYEFTIHNLTVGVKYEYRVLNNETVVDDWAAIPDAEREKEEAPYDTAKEKWSGTASGAFTTVETRYANAPEISEDTENNCYIISGLVPNTNYDLAAGTDTTFETFKTIRASADGTIKIYKDGVGENHDVYDDFHEPPYQIRLSATDSTEPGNGETINMGVTVTGEITSYYPNRETEIKLYQGGTLVASGKIAKVQTAGQMKQQFKIENVPAGEYKVVVEKLYHVTYTLNSFVVGDTDVAINELRLLPGDLNNDGYVDGADLTILIDASNFNASPLQHAGTDINGDGYADGGDLTILIDGDNFNATYSK